MSEQRAFDLRGCLEEDHPTPLAPQRHGKPSVMLADDTSKTPDMRARINAEIRYTTRLVEGGDRWTYDEGRKALVDIITTAESDQNMPPAKLERIREAVEIRLESPARVTREEFKRFELLLDQ